MELQYDEYGNGDPNRLHHQLWARGMQASGLDPSYDAHLDVVPLEASSRTTPCRCSACIDGSVAPRSVTSPRSRRPARCRRAGWSQGLKRLGFPDELVAYYAEHVEADAVHEQLAVRTICAGLLEEEPELEPDVWFGAFTCLDLEDRFARTMLARWGVEERAA